MSKFPFRMGSLSFVRAVLPYHSTVPPPVQPKKRLISRYLLRPAASRPAGCRRWRPRWERHAPLPPHRFSLLVEVIVPPCPSKGVVVSRHQIIGVRPHTPQNRRHNAPAPRPAPAGCRCRSPSSSPSAWSYRIQSSATPMPTTTAASSSPSRYQTPSNPGDRLRVAGAVYQGLLRLEAVARSACIPAPHHQRLRAVQLEQQRYIAVAVAVPVGKVDAGTPPTGCTAALWDRPHSRTAPAKFVVIEKSAPSRVDAHQHIGVLAAAGDGAAVPDDAGNAPVPATSPGSSVSPPLLPQAAMVRHSSSAVIRAKIFSSFSPPFRQLGRRGKPCSAMDNISSRSFTSPNRTKMPSVTALLHTCASASGRKRILSR